MKSPERCPWVDLRKPLYVSYHDQEWGVPVHDDRRMFELLVLESAQAGLSWYTVLGKRENYRRLFDGFDPHRIATYDARKIEALLGDAGIIRNRLKIESAVNNAQRYLELVAERGSFADYLWNFVGGKVMLNQPRSLADYACLLYTSPSPRD